jgi:hypothetical protein
MDFQFDVIFIDSFMDDVTYVRDVEVCVERMICYIPVECTCLLKPWLTSCKHSQWRSELKKKVFAETKSLSGLSRNVTCIKFRVRFLLRSSPELFKV